MSLIEFREEGIYCSQADVYIDPWRSVEKAIVTHGHSDHARPGSKSYLTHIDNLPVIRHRLGKIKAEGVEYGQSRKINGVSISLHPAGHIIGSSQVRLEYKGEIWVISGDYKLDNDHVSAPFEPVKCHSFVTESTFGLPVYRWKPQDEVMAQIHSWWIENQEEGLNSVLVAYSLGKAQRLIANLDERIGNIFVHGAVDHINKVLEEKITKLKVTRNATTEFDKKEHTGSLVITPSSGLGTPWMRKFEPFSLAMASGWMSIRGARRWRAADRGFVISDHADWEQLNTAVRETGAENIYVTHGYSLQFSNWLQEQGLNAQVVQTEFEAEEERLESREEGNRY